MNFRFAILAITVLSVSFARTGLVHEALADEPRADSAASGAHYYEQRVYTTDEGKLPHLHARFRNHTNYLFVKHGMRLIGYWTPTDKPNTLVYMLAYPSKESREASWKAFMDDVEWKRVWKESKEKAGGKIVTKVESTFMTPTDYSPLR